jgi:hypothetical protein
LIDQANFSGSSLETIAHCIKLHSLQSALRAGGAMDENAATSFMKMNAI